MRSRISLLGDRLTYSLASYFMLNYPNSDLRDKSIHFLEQTPQQRQSYLRELGISRYAEILNQIPLNEANIICVMRFLANPSRLKFPNLVGADLSGLVLNGVNLIRGNLSEASLRCSSLIDADLLFANLTNADLTGADLTGATLNETIWLGSVVDRCRFGTGIGLSQEQRRDLQLRGAIFKDG